MTNVYLIRHAEAEPNVESKIRPLTDEGWEESKKVTRFLCDKNIDVVFSSPYRRCVDTLMGFFVAKKLEMKKDDRFCERKRNSYMHFPMDVFEPLMRSLWSDFYYRPEEGEESLADLQTRSVSALKEILDNYIGKNIVIGIHSITMHSILYNYNHKYGVDSFLSNLGKMPWIVKMSFEKQTCIGLEEIDLPT